MNYLNNTFISIFDKIKDDFNVVFEVGCRDCLDTINLSKYFTNAKIYGFECNPDMINICHNNLKNNNNPDNILFFNYGLGNEKTELEFYAYIRDNPGASSFFKRIDYNYTQQSRGKVNIDTINNIVKKYNIDCIDLLCMDTQGFELNILKGANEFIKNIKYIIIEEPRKKIDEKWLPKGLHSKYIGAPSASEIQTFLNDNNFIEIARTYENELEDNVMYKNEHYYFK
jgi:FkbM family methyltransferase